MKIANRRAVSSHALAAAFAWLLGVSLFACGASGGHDASPATGAQMLDAGNARTASAGEPAKQGAGGVSTPSSPLSGTASGTAGTIAAPHPQSTPPVQPMPPAKPTDAGAQTPPVTMTVADPPTEAVLYWLDILANEVWRAKADGSDAHTIVTGSGVSAPDGIGVDVSDGHLFWTNMGSALGGANLATVQRANLTGGSVETIVPAGVGNTFKQMTIDHVHHKLYWCDREGAKVWRANFDGSEHEVLVSAHGINQAVGIALDVPRAQFYFTDRNLRKISRANFEMPAGKTDATRDDVEELFAFAAGAMPIDLDLDKRMIYWTDRGLGTLTRAGMDLPAGQSSSTDAEVLLSGLSEPIGISLDLKAGYVYFGELSGAGVSRVDITGKNKISLTHSGSVTGVTLVHLPLK